MNFYFSELLLTKLIKQKLILYNLMYYKRIVMLLYLKLVFKFNYKYGEWSIMNLKKKMLKPAITIHVIHLYNYIISQTRFVKKSVLPPPP